MKINAVVVALFAVLAGTAHGADFALLRNGFSLPFERRLVMQDTTRLYLSAKGNDYVDIPTDQIVAIEKDSSPAPARTGQPSAKPVSAPAGQLSLMDLVNWASDRHLIDADLITSVIDAESGFQPRAVSPKGAEGLMQLMPETASRLGVKNVFDPAANIDGGTRYLRELLDRYHYDMVKALAAYNAGPERVERYRGVPPYRETRAYVARVIRTFNRKKLAGGGTVAAARSPAKPAHSPAPPTGGARQAYGASAP